jgi:hypothetical protein
MEKSLESNKKIVKGNVESLEERVERLMRRLQEVGRG